MALTVTNEVHNGYYDGKPYTEYERHVAGDHNYASVYYDDLLLTIGGLPEITLKWDRARDLLEVLGAAIRLRPSEP